jgi:predicted metal-binding membrane protein
VALPAHAAARSTVRQDWRAYTWGAPDWWLGAAVVLAWMALTWMFLAMYAGPMHGGHDHEHAVTGGAMSYAELLGSWGLMAVALMLPLVRKRARWLAFRSLRARRQQAVAVFTVVYLAVWVAAGALAIALLAPVRGSTVAVALALVVAACWQCAPPRRRLLRRCGFLRAPAVRGVRAVADQARAGLRAGTRCIATCWALMLPMAIAHHPALMVGAALVLASERRRGPNPEMRGARRLEALWLGAAAFVAAGIAVAG